MTAQLELKSIPTPCLPQVIHIDMKFNNDILLLDGLFQFNAYINTLAEKVVTTTNTLSEEVKQVQILIHMGAKLDSFDLLIEILHELKELHADPNIEMMNIFLN
jgi:hypothetical protein